MTSPASHGAPEPPAGFRGSFRSDPAARVAAGGAAGPIRLDPVAVAVPRDAEDLSCLVAWAAAEGRPVFPRGAGTGMPGGNVGAGICVDLSSWTEAASIDVAARRATVAPGVVADRLDAAAGAQGLRFPPMPSSAKRCTLGGMLANNAAGVRSFRHGAVRAWVEGLEVVLPDGSQAELHRSAPAPAAIARVHARLRARLQDAAGPAPSRTPDPWPDVRKNASGYALDHFMPEGDPVALMVGSEGTLGFITRAHLRLQPLPADSVLAFVAVPALGDLPGLIREVESAGASACEFFASRFLDVAGLRTDPELGPVLGHASAALLVEIEGDRAGVEDGTARLRALIRGLGGRGRLARRRAERARLWETRHAASPVIAAQAADGLVSMQFIEDSVVRPHHLPTYLAELDEILAREETDAVMFGHAGDGNVHVNPLIDVRRPDWRARVRRILESTVDLVAGLHGTLSGEHGDGRIRAPYHARIFGEATARAFGVVKETLDPKGILNPGVLLALPGQDPLEGLSPEPRRRS